MNTAFWSSYVVLWLLVLVLAYLMLGLLRSRRPLPMPTPPAITSLAGDDLGLEVGELFPQMQFQTAFGGEIELSSSKKQGTIVVFTVPGCVACKALYPQLASFLKAKPELDNIILSFSGDGGHDPTPYEKEFALRWVPMSMKMLTVFKNSAFPFAYFVSPEGKILSKGVVNSAEHLAFLVKSALH